MLFLDVSRLRVCGCVAKGVYKGGDSEDMHLLQVYLCFEDWTLIE